MCGKCRGAISSSGRPLSNTGWASNTAAEPLLAVHSGVLFNDLVLTSARIADTSSRLKKVGLLATLLRGLEPDEVAIALGFLTGGARQGKIGIGWATVSAARTG